MEDWHMISSNLHRFTEKLPIRLINKWCGCFKKKRKKERCDHQEWALVHCWFISALTPLSITSVQFSCSVTRVFSNTTVQSINSSAFTSITSRQYGLCPAPSWAWERQAPGCAKEEFPISDGHLSTVFCHIPGATLLGPTEPGCPGEHQASAFLTAHHLWTTVTSPPVQVPIPGSHVSGLDTSLSGPS